MQSSKWTKRQCRSSQVDGTAIIVDPSHHTGNITALYEVGAYGVMVLFAGSTNPTFASDKKPNTHC
jgi:hypothetical protein